MSESPAYLPLYSVADTRAIEKAAFARRPSFSLMRQAGEAVAAVAQQLLVGQKQPIVSVAGGGNNGGDAFIAAASLRRAGYLVRVLFTGDAARLSADGKQALAQWQSEGGKLLPPDAAESALADAALIIDGLFGIGLSRPVEGVSYRLIEQINAAAAKTSAAVVSVDIPSGIDADSGAVMGVAVAATATVTFFGGKLGLYTGDGIDHCGEVHIAGLDEDSFPASSQLLCALPNPERLRRRKNSHKGSYGTCQLIGGAEGMLGALLLAARAAALMGAGKVRAEAMGRRPLVDWRCPDIIWRGGDDDLECSCYAVGMGMGLDESARARLHAVLPMPQPLLLDADALTLLAGDPDQYQPILHRRTAPTVLTPHPREAARLLACDVSAVNQNRPAAARQLAAAWRATVVLKGAGSIIAAADGDAVVCAAGNAGLARGGSGDVLSGIIAALLTQTADGDYAARAGVWLHAAAADVSARRHGLIGVDINQLAATAATLVHAAQGSC